MAFAIQITEVGPAEFPLIQTLRETIFSESAHSSRSSIADQLSGQPDLLLLMAHLEGNPVGFAAGYRRMSNLFYYVNYLGVLPDYRRQGLGKSLLQRQIDFARAHNYRRIEFNTFNHFPWMLRLGLSAGFGPIGLTQDESTRGRLAILFAKELRDEPPPQVHRNVSEFETDEFVCPSDDAASLRRALDAGFEFRGMMHQPGQQRPLMILHRNRP